MRIGALREREGSLYTLSSTSYKVSGWISVVSTKNHRALSPGHVVGLLQQTLTRPTGDGKHGRVLFAEILLHPTLITMRFILFEISLYCSCLLPAVSQSIFAHVPDM